jgi:hypothetical protein
MDGEYGIALWAFVTAGICVVERPGRKELHLSQVLISPDDKELCGAGTNLFDFKARGWIAL